MVGNTALALSGAPAAVAGNGLTVVVFATVAFSLVMSVAFLLSRGGSGGSMYDEIGRGGISREEDGRSGGLAGRSFASPAASRAEQEQEVRQMLQARSERMVRRGEAPLDVEAETRRLLSEAQVEPGGNGDAGLEEEVRQLVIARNERRQRSGMEPLDVEAEVARTLRELAP